MKFKLGTRIKEWRESFPNDSRPTIMEMAVMFGVSSVTLLRYMDNDVVRPDLTNVGRICNIIGVTDVNDVIEIESEAE